MAQAGSIAGESQIRPVRAEDLRPSPPLAFWPEAALERVARASVMPWHDDGEVLARAWEPARAIWVVAEGCVELTRTSATGQRYLADLMSAPQVAGLLPMIDGRESLFEARVRSRSRLITCPTKRSGPSWKPTQPSPSA
jgi:CRP-like cAMP-binding protein